MDVLNKIRKSLPLSLDEVSKNTQEARNPSKQALNKQAKIIL